MEDKTPKTNETQKDETKVESPRQSSQERIVDVIVASIERAKTNGGTLLNATQKTRPAIYDSKMQQSPFNNLLIAMHSDQNDFKTNLVTFFSDAKKRGESVRGGQKGLPVSWITWQNFEKKDDPSVKISRSDYMAMPKEEQEKFRGIRSKEMRIVFNIDQTTMPSVNKEAYEKVLEQNGSVDERTVNANTDKQLRIDVNQFILATRDNLVPIRKDGSGIASYDKSADVVHVPAQNAYASYPEYVQDVVRNVVSATAHPQRLNRHSSQNYDTLLTEISSAAKLLEFGLPAKLSPKAMENADAMIDMLKKNPKLVDSLERDINSSLTMIQKAQRGEKIELRPTQADIDRWRAKLPKEGTTPDMFDAILMLKDDKNKWTLYVKPENENGFAVHPDPKDVSMFFNIVKGQGPMPTGQDAESFVANFRKEMGQKYYADVAKNPGHAINLFGTDAPKEIADKLEKVNIFKTKDETPRILMVGTVEGGERLKAKELTPDQWQRLWLAPNMKEFKKNLGATMYKEEIAEKFNIPLVNSQKNEQKAEMKEPVTLDIPKWSLNYIMNGEAEGLTDEEKEIVDNFLDEHFADGFIPEIVEGSDKDFNVSPAFGTRNPNALPNKGESPYQAVETVEVKFYPSGYFERRSESQELGETTVVVDNTKEQEEKFRNSPEQKKKEEIEEKAKEEATKQETKAIAKVALSPMLKQFMDLKKKHPDALLLFRCGDFYETYQKDADKASKILGITLTKSTKTKDLDGKPLAMAGFPYHALDTYLPKLIRAGERVAICDQIEAPKQTAKRGVSELLTPGEKQEVKQDAPEVEQEQTRSHGFHR